MLLLFPLGCITGYLFARLWQRLQSTEVVQDIPKQDDPETVAFIEGLKELEQAKQAERVGSLSSEVTPPEDMDRLATVPANYFLLH